MWFRRGTCSVCGAGLEIIFRSLRQYYLDQVPGVCSQPIGFDEHPHGLKQSSGDWPFPAEKAGAFSVQIERILGDRFQIGPVELSALSDLIGIEFQFVLDFPIMRQIFPNHSLGILGLLGSPVHIDRDGRIGINFHLFLVEVATEEAGAVWAKELCGSV